MLDFYLIVSSYREAYGQGWLAAANALIPPNVFPFQHGGLAAKYAVLSEADFYRLNGPETRNVSVWARFAQPSRLVWAADEMARVIARSQPFRGRRRPCLARRGRRAGANRRSIGGDGLFADLFGRACGPSARGAAGSVVDADPDRYDVHRRRRWRQFEASANRGQLAPPRLEGKLLSVVRLAKASATFAGGAEYIAWKINRHAGTDIQLKPWQRRSRCWRRSACCRGSSGPARFVKPAAQAPTATASQRADRERLSQQLVADQILALAFADIARDEQHGDSRLAFL